MFELLENWSEAGEFKVILVDAILQNSTRLKTQGETREQAQWPLSYLYLFLDASFYFLWAWKRQRNCAYVRKISNF